MDGPTLDHVACYENSAFLGVGDMKFDAAVIVCLDRRSNIEVAERDFLDAIIEDVHHLAHDGVVRNFLLVAVAKYQYGWVDRCGVRRAFRTAVLTRSWGGQGRT